ncbi:hypothetical protein [Paraburkholderia sp. BL6669N2]|uniref:hypothetical protein n=1 Tax=Paraburkholderia sp. BL6669N2 TaxID=1938807 RepID=UPI0011C03285|nr:hypothetical protein [Paraburkholderia sp. BL6669N2]
MDSILYLGVEGVLFRVHAHSHTVECRAHVPPSTEPLPLLEPVSAIVAHETKLKIVLNSWLVFDYGFRRLLRLLPAGIAQKTIGATIAGNRLHSRPMAYRARAELLREDVERRKPTQITIVDASRSAIPTELLHRSICVNESDFLCPAEFSAILRRFVDSENQD